ncbi:MAG: UrcA family protein [Caulobacteraceae bacterium]
MSFKSTLTVLTAVSALGFTLAAQHATAQSAETVSVKVFYGDLNLSTQAGAKVMLHRIRHAAETICGPVLGDPIEVMYEYRPCVSAITNRTVARFDNPIVTALNSGKGAPAAMALASNR